MCRFHLGELAFEELLVKKLAPSCHGSAVLMAVGWLVCSAGFYFLSLVIAFSERIATLTRDSVSSSEFLITS